MDNEAMPIYVYLPCGYLMIISYISYFTGEHQRPSYQTSGDYCVSQSQCNKQIGELCWWYVKLIFQLLNYYRKVLPCKG